MRRVLARSLLWAALLPNCGAGPAPVASALTISAVIDGEEPLAGVRVSAGGRLLGETDANGHIVTEIGGREGEDIPLLATCPAGYRGPAGPIGVRLSRVRSLGNAAGALLVTVPCRPSKRRLVVVVSVPALPDAPVFVNGTSGGRTDDEGVAHVLVPVVPGDVVTVALGLSHPARSADRALAPRALETFPAESVVAPRLMRSFRASDADEILVLAETVEQTSRARPLRTRSVEPRAHIERIE